MRKSLVLFCTLAALGVLPGLASGHTAYCHTIHTCPSDHHSYIWYDSSGQAWSCAKIDAPEYNPALDTQAIYYNDLLGIQETYDADPDYQYWCQSGGPAPTPPEPTISLAQYRQDMIEFVKDRTGRSPKSLSIKRCTTPGLSYMTCEPSWYDSSGEVYAGTAFIEHTVQGGVLYWDGVFSGLRAKSKCLRHSSVHHCAKKVKWS